MITFTYPVFAYNGLITASPASGSSITNIRCGSTTTVQVNIQNNGGGQALCWYHTDASSTWTKGTTNCVPSGSGTTSFNANIEMPFSNSETRVLYVQCNDYYGLSSPSCNAGTPYNSPSQCSVLSTACFSSLSQTFTYAVSCSPPQFTISPDNSYLSLICGGQPTTVSINMHSQDTHNLQCAYRINDGQTTNINVPLVASGSYSFSVPIGYPSPCTTQLTTYKVDVVCSDSISTLANTQSTSIQVSYTSDPCIAALADARSAISDAQTAITNAQSKIQEANRIGADVTSAQSSLNQANSQLSSAQTSVTTAQNSCNNGDKTNGVNQANNAKSSATSAKTYATDALNTAQQAVTAFAQKKTDASNKISDANSKIDSSAIMINKADGVITNATSLSSAMPELTSGWDLITPKSNVNTARAKIDQAKSYIQEANTAFSQNNFDLAKSKADSALQLSNDANDLATQAYDTLNEKVMALGEVAQAVMSASTEISQTDEILSKMDYIIKSVEKWNVDLTEAKTITSDGQTSIDTAKDLLAQAKNRYQSGMSSDAISKAIEARDKAAEPADRLNRIVSSIKTNIVDALEKAQSDAKSKITSSENAVNDASKTYGANSEEIVAGQNDVSNAKSKSSETDNYISSASSAEDLTTLIQAADSGFKALDSLGQLTTSAVNHANTAKTGLVTTIGGAAVVGVGTVGGGFLYWRRKKKKGKTKEEGKKSETTSKPAEEKKEEKPKEKVEIKNYCKKCKIEYPADTKFCKECGSKLTKKREKKVKNK